MRKLSWCLYMYRDRLKNLRLEKGLLQKDLAKILDISEISYTHYESEYFIMPLRYLIKMCDYFDVSLDYLLEFSNRKLYNNLKKECDSEKFSLRLKNFRKENNITQAKLAKVLNTTQSAIANYEKGTNFINTPFLYMICKKYNISADYLLGRIDEPKDLK